MELDKNWWATSSWSSKLYNALRPAPLDSIRPNLAKSFSRFRHSPGDIWKHTFSNAIYHDLSEVALEHDRLGTVTRRRFVRVEHIGLSGIIFYQMLVPSSIQALTACLSVCVSHYLTLENVFGDLDNPSEHGMDLDDLLDAVDPKMVYFPECASTSFVIGQVMSAFLHDQPQYHPQPAFRGFSVCLGESNTDTLLPPSNVDALEHLDIGDIEASVKLTLNQLRCFGKNLMNTPSKVDDPYISLCIRSSSLQTSNSSGTREELESVTSAFDSTGPSTRPSLARSSRSQIKMTESLYRYDDLLSFLDLTLEEHED